MGVETKNKEHGTEKIKASSTESDTSAENSKTEEVVAVDKGGKKIKETSKSYSNSKTKTESQASEKSKLLSKDKKQKIVEESELKPKIKKTLSSDTLHETASLLSSYEADRDEDNLDKTEAIVNGVNYKNKINKKSTEEKETEESSSLRSSTESNPHENKIKVSPNYKPKKTSRR